MSIENNQLIRRFYTEVVGGGDYSDLDSFVATDYLDHNAPEADVALKWCVRISRLSE